MQCEYSTHTTISCNDSTHTTISCNDSTHTTDALCAIRRNYTIVRKCDLRFHLYFITLFSRHCLVYLFSPAILSHPILSYPGIPAHIYPCPVLSCLSRAHIPIHSASCPHPHQYRCSLPMDTTTVYIIAGSYDNNIDNYRESPLFACLTIRT
jgi:hypothetical protein